MQKAKKDGKKKSAGSGRLDYAIKVAEEYERFRAHLANYGRRLVEFRILGEEVRLRLRDLEDASPEAMEKARAIFGEAVSRAVLSILQTVLVDLRGGPKLQRWKPRNRRRQ